jgi:hypothetical protein
LGHAQLRETTGAGDIWKSFSKWLGFGFGILAERADVQRCPAKNSDIYWLTRKKPRGTVEWPQVEESQKAFKKLGGRGCFRGRV